MKRELLGFLACPVCRGDLDLRETSRENGEILEGYLACRACTKEFAVKGGIPRLVIDHTESATAERFGYEWKNFPRLSQLYEEQFLDWISPVDREFFSGKTVLDAGCGKGRHLYLAARFGAGTIVGIDVSDAVEVAYINTRHLSNIHVVQADLFHPPLKRAFDYIYSVGVLHHLPRPGEGFRVLCGLLKEGGTFSIWVYGKEGNEWIAYLVDPVRRFVTSRIPLPVLQMVSFPLAFSLYVLCKLLYKPVNTHFRSVGRFLFYNDYLFYISKFDLKELYSIVFDHLLAPVAFYLPRDEVQGWFESCALGGVNIEWHNKNSWRAVGRLECGRRDDTES
jgi:SAM-dependent methyltransferase